MTYALRAEWTKLRSLPGTGWLLIAAIISTVAVSVAAAAAVRCPSGGCAEDPARISLTGVYLGQAVIAIVAVLSISDEYGTGMIRVTFAAVPRRIIVLAAKATVLTGVAALAGVIAIGVSLLAGALILPGHGIGPAHGYPALSLADGPVLRAAVGSVLYLMLIALFSIGVATCARDSAASVGVVLARLEPESARPAVRPDDRGPGHPGHHEPERPPDRPVGGPRRASRLVRRGSPSRRAAAQPARRVTDRL
jgi:ABC-2 type transport system permease protein